MIRITRQEALAYRAAIEASAESLTDEQAIKTPMLFKRWRVGVEYAAGARVSHDVDGDILLYRCRDGMGHISQSDWPPNLAVSMWERVDDPAIEWPEWVMPTGSHDAYKFGAKVSHNGKHWVSNYDGANIWEPGVFGWEEVVL